MAGLVILRQRPGTAKGVIFLTLEDETGIINVIVWRKLYERFRRAVISGRMLRVTGRLQRAHSVPHVIAEQIEDISTHAGPVVAGTSLRGRICARIRFTLTCRKTPIRGPSMIPIRSIIRATLLSGLAACATQPGLGGLGEPDVMRLTQIAPPGAAPGTCWGKSVTPAIIETVTHQVLLQPAQVMSDGSVTQPAIYKTETLQQIVRERRETWFLTPCPKDMTPEFNANVQRALAARGLYRGDISGEMNAATRAAVRRYQKPQGLDSGILSLAAARKLGLVAVKQES